MPYNKRHEAFDSHNQQRVSYILFFSERDEMNGKGNRQQCEINNFLKVCTVKFLFNSKCLCDSTVSK